MLSTPAVKQTRLSQRPPGTPAISVYLNFDLFIGALLQADQAEQDLYGSTTASAMADQNGLNAARDTRQSFTLLRQPPHAGPDHSSHFAKHAYT